jgi:hypothetical protein
MNKHLLRLIPLLIVLSSYVPVCSAQIKNTGTVLGQVTDPTGATVPNAAINLRNVDTGAVLKTQTDANGDYAFPVVPVGKYSLSAAGSGFKTTLLRDFTVNAVENVRLNPTLQVGDVIEQVTVEAVAPTVDSVTASLGDTVVGKQIQNLPISSRLFTQLIFLEPGVVSNNPEGGGGFGSNSSANFSLNGVRSDQNNMQVDGIRNLDTFGGNAFVSPNLNSLQEFRIENNSYSAATGRSAGGQINLITRSGTNAFHGSAFEYFRNDKLNARNFFATEKPENRYNNFGYTIGGPIKKEKLFFFWSQEWRRIIESSGTRTATVATDAQRNGDFAGLLPDRVITDPDTRQPFPGNIIPGNRIDPNAALLLNTYFPRPNFQSGALNFTASNPDITFWREESARVDFRPTNSLSVFARFTYDSSFLRNPFELFGRNVLPNVGGSIQDFPISNGAFDVMYTPRPNFVGEFRWGFYKGNDKRLEHTAESNRNRAPGLNIPELFPFNEQNRIPSLEFSQGYAGITLPWPFHNYAYSMPFEGHFTWIKGLHTIRWGIGVTREGKGEVASATGNLTNGSFVFDGSATGDALADFLVGRAFSYTETAEDPFGVYRWVNIEPYAEDQLKLKSNVTLTLGVRYSYYQPEVEKNNLQNFFDAKRFDASTASVVQPDGLIVPGTENVMNGLVQVGGNAPFGRATINSQNTNLAPRVGIVWDPTSTGKMAVRLGYGIFYDRWGSFSQFSSTNPPFTQQVQVFDTLLSHPGQRPGGGASEQPIYPVALRTNITPWKYPQVQKWSAGIQYDFGHSLGAEVTYVGTKSTHLIGIIDLNQINPNPEVASGAISPNAVRPFPGFSSITAWGTNRNATYNGLQTSLKRRVGAGFAFQVSYTLSKTLTDASDVWGGPQDSRNIRAEKGLASFDARHVFVANYLWDVPLGRNAKGAAKAVLGSWQVSGITRFQSGSPLTVFAPGDIAGIGTGGQRPDLLADPNGPKTLSRWFNTDAFVSPPPLTFGSAGVGIIRGPGISNWDFALYKMIPLPTERFSTQFRAQFFNVFNHSQFSGVDTSFGGGSFGQVVTARSPRVIQLGMELQY